MLFAKEKKANQLEVYNDINSNLVNLFRCVKYHCGELQREMEWMLTSREQFFDCLAQGQGRGLTDIQRAARFFYIINCKHSTKYSICVMLSLLHAVHTAYLN